MGSPAVSTALAEMGVGWWEDDGSGGVNALLGGWGLGRGGWAGDLAGGREGGGGGGGGGGGCCASTLHGVGQLAVSQQCVGGT